MCNVIICYMPMAFDGCSIQSFLLLIKTAVQTSEHGMIDRGSLYTECQFIYRVAQKNVYTLYSSISLE